MSVAGAGWRPVTGVRSFVAKFGSCVQLHVKLAFGMGRALRVHHASLSGQHTGSLGSLEDRAWPLVFVADGFNLDVGFLRAS